MFHSISIEKVAGFYLAAPLILMLLTWLPIWIGLPLAAIVIWANMALSDSAPALKPVTLAALAILSLGAILLSGTSPLVESIPYLDLAKHRWIYHDLITMDWPVVYDTGEILRYTLGGYLVPAFISKFAGSPYIWWVLWYASGLLLFLSIAAGQFLLWRALAVGVILVMFGGLDELGVAILHPERQANGWLRFREDWSNMPFGWLIGSSAFSLSWTPQHAIPAMIGAAIIWQNFTKPDFFRRSIPLFASIALWSPFVAVSFAAVVAGLAINRQLLKTIVSMLSLQNVALLLPIGVLAAYLSLGSSKLPANIGPLLAMADPANAWHYIVFMGCEVGIVAAATFWVRREFPVPAIVSLCFIALLPLAYVSASNDLMMRGAMLPTVIVALYAVDALWVDRHYVARVMLALVLAAGIYSSVNESARLIFAPKTEGDWQQSITAMDLQYRNQYLAPNPLR